MAGGQQPPDQRPRRGCSAAYLEVGVNRGETFLAVEIAEKTAVDPEFRFDWQAAAGPGAVFHRCRRTPVPRLPRRAFDIVFLDGLHVFAQTFRDFCDTLLVTHARSLIVIDDTVPDDIYSSLAAARARAGRSAGRPAASAARGTATSSRSCSPIHDFFPRLSFCTIGDRGQPADPGLARAAAGLPAAVQLAGDRQPDELVRDAPELRADAGDAGGRGAGAGGGAAGLRGAPAPFGSARSRHGGGRRLRVRGTVA